MRWLISCIAVVPAVSLANGFAEAGGSQANLDVVFVLDTTGSMSREITEAKQMVEELAQVFQDQRRGSLVRFGVVAYKDIGDDYVTKLHPLTADMESTRQFLGTLSADGGGDGPEHTLQGVQVALSDAGFASGKQTERQIFVIADAPWHAYPDGPTLAGTVSLAVQHEVVVHTIGCRSISDTGRHQMQELSYATEGRYQHIGAVASAGLGEAVLSAAVTKDAPKPQEDVALYATTVEDGSSRHLAFSARWGSLRNPDEGVDLSTPDACTITIMLPDGVGVDHADATATDDLFTVSLWLVSGEGGLQRFELEKCMPTALPITVSLEG